MKILGIDYGEKNIGLALSDPQAKVAFPYINIKNESDEQITKIIKDLVYQQKIEKIVVGLPYNMNGTLGRQAQIILEFCEKLKREINITVETWDERLSSIETEKLLIEQDVSRKKRREIKDKVSASIILQNYLEFLNLK